MDRSFEDHLIEALDALDAGDPIETIVRRYPVDAEARLRSALLAARAVRSLRVDPSHSAQARSRAAFLAEATRRREAISSVPPRRALMRLPLIQMMSVVIVVLGLAGVVVYASESAMPNGSLYGVKRGVETMRLGLASGSQRDELEAQFNQERLREVQVLLDHGQSAEVMFSGEIEAITDDIWYIAGLPVLINKTTLIRGVAGIGQPAAVSGYTRDGAIYAIRIEVGGSMNTIPDPDKVLPTATVPIKEGDPQGRPTLDGSPTRPVTNPSATPSQPLPTATAAPDHSNDNENSNDNGDDSGGHSGSGGGGDNGNSNSNTNDND